MLFLLQFILTVIGFVLLFNRQGVAALFFLIPGVMLGFIQLFA